MTYTDLNTFVVRGERYVLSFSYSGIAIPPEDLQNSVAAMVPLVSNPIIRSNGTTGGNIDFEFTAAAVTTFGILVQTLLNVWDELYPAISISWVQACDAPCGLVSGSECGINDLGACFADAKTAGYIVIAILALIVVIKVT